MKWVFLPVNLMITSVFVNIRAENPDIDKNINLQTLFNVDDAKRDPEVASEKVHIEIKNYCAFNKLTHKFQ